VVLGWSQLDLTSPAELTLLLVGLSVLPQAVLLEHLSVSWYMIYLVAV